MANAQPWYLWLKIGDSHSESDRGLKDGEPTQYYPATGYDEFGNSYATDYIGPGDRKGFIVALVQATEEEISELFKKPRSNSNAYKKNRTTNYFLNLEDTFTAKEVENYRDHKKEVNALPIFSLNTLSDYRLKPERLNKSFMHGSVTSGSYTVGPGFIYSTLKAAIDDVGAVASNLLTFIIMASHSISLAIDFDKDTNADGLICIKGNTKYGYKNNPSVSTGGSLTKWNFDDECNYLFEDLYLINPELSYSGDSTTARTHTYRRIYIEETTGSNNLLEFQLFNNNPALITFKMYDCVLDRYLDDATREIYLDMRNWSTSDWDSNFYFENNTFICEVNSTGQFIQVSATSPAGSTFAIRNNVFLFKGTGAYTVNNASSGTFQLINCAYNEGNTGTVTDTNGITDLVASDMLSTTYTEPNTGDIDPDSRLWQVGTADKLTENEVDIIGDPWVAASPSIGAFSAIAPRDPVDSVALKDNVAQHTTLEIELSEHITGLSAYSGDAYSISNYYRDDFNSFNGDKISVYKELTSLEADGVALVLKANAAEVVSNSGSWWQDTANAILYVHFTEDDTPSQHTVVAHFKYYLSEDGVVLTVGSDERYFEPYIDPTSLPSIKQRFNEALVGTVNISGGNFTLLNGNGIYDQLLNKYIWHNRRVTIKRGYDSQAYTDFTTLNVVDIISWRFNKDKVTFKVKNKFNSLFEQIPAQTFQEDDATTFGGITYGSTYPEKLIGKPKPLAWGIFDERQAPVLHMVREDTSFVSFALLYTSTSKTDADMSPTAPAYNPNVTFTATGIEENDDGYVRSFVPTLNGDYFDREDGFWKGYYVRVDSIGLQAKITGFRFNRVADAQDTAEITLDTGDADNRIVGTAWTDFKIYCPLYHYMVANHTIKSIESMYVDKGDDDGVRPWIHLEDETELVDSEWYRVVVPIPGHSSSTNARAAFTSKDTSGGGSVSIAVLENHADVVEDILINPDVLSAPFVFGDLDSASFTASRNDRDYPVAIYLNEPIKTIDVLKKIRQGVIAKFMITGAGVIKYVTWNPSDPVAAGIVDLTISEIINGNVDYGSSLDDIYYGFIILHSLDGAEDDYLEERYTYEPTLYIFRTSLTKKIETYLRNPSHAQRTAQRYTYFNRNKIVNMSLSIPHNLKNDGDIEESLYNPGEYVRITNERAPGPETEYGDEFGEYQKTYELLQVNDNSKELKLSGDNIKGLAINSGYWSSTLGAPPTGFWCNDDGETVPGDDSTKNLSLWV